MFCGLGAPRVVYAGNLKNSGSKIVSCTVYYHAATNTSENESFSVTLEPGSEAAIPERIFKPTPDATHTERKTVTRIDANAHGETLSLEEPFDGVTGPEGNWNFTVFDDRIVSGGFF